MTVEVKVPTLPESVPDATLLDWRKQVGDAVEQDEILVELETDKVVLEVPAPSAGVLAEIVMNSGDTAAWLHWSVESGRCSQCSATVLFWTTDGSAAHR